MRMYVLMIATMFALVSCGKEILEPAKEMGEPAAASIAFNLKVNHPDASKALKSGWEAGDAIFVFFNNVPAPKFLKMSSPNVYWSAAMRSNGKE